MGSQITSRLALVLSCLLLWGKANGATQNIAAFQLRHQAPTMVERRTPFEFSFAAPGVNPDDIEEAYLFYRLDGDLAYNQQPAALVASTFKSRLTIEDKQATSLEYYLEIHLNNGEKVTYPQSDASDQPVRVEIVDARKSERQQRVEATGVDYTILSPNPGSTVAQRDAIIALTLFYDPARVDTAHSSFQMLLDNQDVTQEANANDYFYTYSTDNLAAGKHTVTFNLQKADTVLNVVRWQFSVLDPEAVTTVGDGRNSNGSWIPKGKVELTARDQQIGGYANDALSGNVSISGHKGSVSYAAHGLVTTQEDPRLQSQNRFGARLDVGDWLELEAGHVYPRLSMLTIAGQRMQGVDAAFHIWNNALNMHFVHGKLRRSVENIYSTIHSEYQIFQGTSVDTTYALDIDDGGTFRRKITGGRLGVGRGNNFEFGLNVLKVEDDTSSIKVVRDYNSLTASYPQLMQGLSSSEQQDLATNPGQLNVNGNPRPEGNFVASSDLDVSFDNDRIRLQAEGGASLLNRDISNGVLDQEAVENLGINIDSQTLDLLDQLSWLIVINENLEALPQRFAGDEYGTSFKAFVPSSILATQSELGMHYFRNNLRFRYRWVGPNYNSLANSTIRKDIAGLTISDRFRLLQDRIYVTLGYETLHDNVSDSKKATTNTHTYRGNISWYPIDPDLPSLSFGLMSRNRDNGVELLNPYVTKSAQNIAVQNYEIQQGDTLLAANSRLSDSYQISTSMSQQFFLLGINNDASLSYSYFTTKDKQYGFGDTRSNSFSMRVVNHFPEASLQTNFGFNINNTKSGSGLTNIRITGVHAGGTMFFLDNRLNLNASVAFTHNRSETTPLTVSENGTSDSKDDYYQADTENSSILESNSYILDAGVRYNLTIHHSFLLNFRYSNVRSVLSRTIIPNDHLLQARYIFNF